MNKFASLNCAKSQLSLALELLCKDASNYRRVRNTASEVLHTTDQPLA